MICLVYCHLLLLDNLYSLRMLLCVSTTMKWKTGQFVLSSKMIAYYPYRTKIIFVLVSLNSALNNSFVLYVNSKHFTFVHILLLTDLSSSLPYKVPSFIAVSTPSNQRFILGLVAPRSPSSRITAVVHL